MTKQSKFAETLAAAISGQGLTLERLAIKLKAAGRPVSVATLSYWQTGRSTPTRAKSLETLSELEHILGVEPGRLTAALPDGPAKWDPLKVLPGSETSEQMLAELRMTLAHTWTKASIRDRLVVRANRTEASQQSHTVQRAAIDGARSSLMVFSQDADDPVTPVVEALFGHELVEVRHLPEEQITVARFELPVPVSRGTLVSVEHIIRMQDTGSISYRLERSVASATPIVLLEVIFEGEPPREVYGYMRTEEGAEIKSSVKPLSGQGHTASYAILDAQPGIHGIGWDW